RRWWHQERGRKTVGELLDAVLALLGRILDVLRRHRVPGEDVEELVCKIEMASARGLTAIDQHGIERRQAAGGARHALEGVHHENEHAKLALHHVRQASRRNIPQLEFVREALASDGRFLVAVALRDPESSSQ